MLGSLETVGQLPYRWLPAARGSSRITTATHHWNSIEGMVYLMIFGLVLSSVKRVLVEEERSLAVAKID